MEGGKEPASQCAARPALRKIKVNYYLAYPATIYYHCPCPAPCQSKSANFLRDFGEASTTPEKMSTALQVLPPPTSEPRSPETSPAASTTTFQPWVTIAARLIARGDSVDTVALLCDQPANRVAQMVQTSWFVKLVNDSPLVNVSAKSKLYESAESIIDEVLRIMRSGAPTDAVKLNAAKFLFEQINGKAVSRSYNINEKRETALLDERTLNAEIAQILEDDHSLKQQLKQHLL